jgi:hypothetical protein
MDPLVCEIILKKNTNSWVCNGMQIQGAFPNSQEEKTGVGVLRWIRMNSQQEFKVKLTCTRKGQLVQVGAKMVHTWAMGEPNSQEIAQPRLERSHHLLYLYYTLWLTMGFALKWQKVLWFLSIKKTY